MKKYLAKKLLLLIPLLLGVTSLTFTLTKALPGDPVFSMVGERAQPEVIEKMRREIGSDKSIFSQYIGYVKLLLRGDFGRSYYTNRKVLDDLLIKFPNTLKLALGSMAVAIPFGIFLGIPQDLPGKRSSYQSFCDDFFTTGFSSYSCQKPSVIRFKKMFRLTV